MSMATVGVGARFGWGVPDDYGIPPQFLAKKPLGRVPTRPTERILDFGYLPYLMVPTSQMQFFGTATPSKTACPWIMTQVLLDYILVLTPDQAIGVAAFP